MSLDNKQSQLKSFFFLFEKLTVSLMATSIFFTSSSIPLSLSSLYKAKNPSHNSLFHSPKLKPLHLSPPHTPIMASASEFLGDFGARDPFPAEIESKFGENVLGNFSTEHKILIPNLAALSLSQLKCSPPSPLQPPISEEEANQLLRKVIGWRLITEEGILKLQCLWKLRDFKCGVELINRICNIVEPEGHFPNLHLEQPNQIRAQLWTASIGGLSMNDFIVAAKIDGIRTSDLVPKKRVWA